MFQSPPTRKGPSVRPQNPRSWFSRRGHWRGPHPHRPPGPQDERGALAGKKLGENQENGDFTAKHREKWIRRMEISLGKIGSSLANSTENGDFTVKSEDFTSKQYGFQQENLGSDCLNQRDYDQQEWAVGWKQPCGFHKENRLNKSGFVENSNGIWLLVKTVETLVP